MKRMTTAVFSALIMTVMLVILPACSSEQPQSEEEAIEVKLLTSEVSTGAEVELKASVTGAEAYNNVIVTFDARIGGRPKLVDAVEESDGVFSGTYTFAEKGKYIVYTHVYAGDLHITKRDTVIAK